jgi:hypothetical protein
VKASVIMETLAGALSVATGAASPLSATRHHVVRRRLRVALTESYAFVHPSIDTFDEADVWTEEIRSVPAAVPAGSAVRASCALAATYVVAAPNRWTPYSQITVMSDAPAPVTLISRPAHATRCEPLP